jgi:hypothetical protein
MDHGTQSDQDKDRLRARAAAIYETLKLIHNDYLLAFAEAEMGFENIAKAFVSLDS